MIHFMILFVNLVNHKVLHTSPKIFSWKRFCQEKILGLATKPWWCTWRRRQYILHQQLYPKTLTWYLLLSINSPSRKLISHRLLSSSYCIQLVFNFRIQYYYRHTNIINNNYYHQGNNCSYYIYKAKFNNHRLQSFITRCNYVACLE